MHSQSTYEELFSCSSRCAVCSSAERQLVWGLVMGFSIVFKRQRTTHMLTSGDTRQWAVPSNHTAEVTVRDPTRGSRDSHCEAPSTLWLRAGQMKGKVVSAKGAASLPTPQRQLAGQGGGLLTQGPASGHPAQGHPRSPLCSPGRRPCCSQRACRPERVRGRAPEPLGFCAMWQPESQPQPGSPHLCSRGWDQATSSRDACDEQWITKMRDYKRINQVYPYPWHQGLWKRTQRSETLFISQIIIQADWTGLTGSLFPTS